MKHLPAIALVTVLGWGCVPVQSAVIIESTPDAGSDVSDRDASSDAPFLDTSSDVSATLVDAGRDAQVETETSVPPVDAADAPSLLGPCSDPCSAVGSFRCDKDARRLQSCVAAVGCTSWIDVTTCQADQVCCSAHCVSADAKNCYACGATCDGLAPVCDKATKACGCDEPSCGALGKVCDGAAHQCTTDPTRPEVYVDPLAGRNEDGSKEHPYRTITAALSSPRAAQSALTVHVARGRYDVEHGETFPLVLRGVTLEGAATNETIIVGTGSYDARVGKGAINAQVSATVVIGETAKKSRITKATIYELTPTPVAAHYGIFCDRGDTQTFSDQVPLVTPNTTLDQVSVGPGYDIALVATTSTDPVANGCNLRATASTFIEGTVGVWAIGCENPSQLGIGRTPVFLQLGDGTPQGGNSIDARENGEQKGLGVLVSGCVPRFLATQNKFWYGDGGVRIHQPRYQNETNSSVLKSNTFDRLLEFGLKVEGAAVRVNELSNNTFSNIRPRQLSLPNPPRAAAILAEGIDDPTFGYFPYISNATGNSIMFSQWGVLFHTSGALGTGFTSSDFHGNFFHCNCMEYSGDEFGIVGGDVLLEGLFPAIRTFSFDGNEWDHSPPTTATVLSTDGTDVTIIGTGTATFAGAIAADPYSCSRL